MRFPIGNSHPSLKRKVQYTLLVLLGLFACFQLKVFEKEGFIKGADFSYLLQKSEKNVETSIQCPWTIFQSRNQKTAEGLLGSIYEVELAVVDFSELAKSWNVASVLIEPSVLFCTLDKKDQELLLKKKFDSAAGSPDVINFALFGSDSHKLINKTHIRLTAKQNGFKSYRVQRALTLQNNYSGLLSSLSTHFFFIRPRVVIHAVVFYERGDYLWHAGLQGLPRKLSSTVSIQRLLYSQFDAAYEKFRPVLLKSVKRSNLFIPSDTLYFLLQIQSSKYIECTVKEVIEHADVSGSKNTTPEIPVTEMKRRLEVKETLVISLKQLKSSLYPLLMQFFIFSGTFLGWYRNCDVIPHTTDVDFAAFGTEIGDEEILMSTVQNMEELMLSARFGFKDEGLEFRFMSKTERQVDFFFLYEEDGKYWTSGHNVQDHYYLKYWFPKFDLCSSELLRQKVLVPCQSEKLIIAEYGPNWMTPETDWYFEKSPKNVGEKTYWPQNVSETYIAYTRKKPRKRTAASEKHLYYVQ